jgi:hypothetical protein
VAHEKVIAFGSALTLKKQGKVVDAREFARRAVVGQRNVLDPAHPDIKKSQELYQ